MMKNLEKQTNIKNEVRKFGMSVGVGLMLWGGMLWWKEWQYAVYELFFAVVFVFLACVFPLFVRPVHQAAIFLIRCVRWIITKVMLVIIFYLILTPISIVARLVHKNFLDIKLEQAKASYWVHRTDDNTGMQQYKNQF